MRSTFAVALVEVKGVGSLARWTYYVPEVQ